MINQVTVTNHLGESIVLELRRPEESGFLVRSIEGLGPSKANVNTTELSTRDGSMYNSGRVNSRNIIFSLVLLEKDTIEDTRQSSYKYFPIKQRIELEISTDNRTCTTYGYVEANEVDIFSKEESTVISVICPDAYFYSNLRTITVLSGTQSGFTFPFSNESLEDKLLQFGSITLITEKTVVYEGDAAVGVTIYIHALGTATGVTIYNVNAGETMEINTTRLAALTGDGIIAGDEIIICTVKGQKSVELLRDGIYTNILNCLERDSTWFQLEKGDNIFTFTADTGSENLQFRIENYTLYEGA